MRCNNCKYLKKFTRIVDDIKRYYPYCSLMFISLEWEENIIRPTHTDSLTVITPFDCPLRQKRRVKNHEKHFEFSIK